MLYSVRMRAAQGGAHEQGGRHISGAERLVAAQEIGAAAAAMAERALGHSRGQADFINIQIEMIVPESIRKVPLLPVRTTMAQDYQQGRQIALQLLIEAGVTSQAAQAGLRQLLALEDSLRGAMLLCSQTGERLDEAGARGIRVSRMDSAEPAKYENQLAKRGLMGTHAREAMLLAAKVMSAPGVVAELCWSDDPDYTAGYVSCQQRYNRITPLKPAGCPLGGRVFFILPGTDIGQLKDYLQLQPVLVEPEP